MPKITKSHIFITIGLIITLIFCGIGIKNYIIHEQSLKAQQIQEAKEIEHAKQIIQEEKKMEVKIKEEKGKDDIIVNEVSSLKSQLERKSTGENSQAEYNIHQLDRNSIMRKSLLDTLERLLNEGKVDTDEYKQTKVTLDAISKDLNITIQGSSGFLNSQK